MMTRNLEVATAENGNHSRNHSQGLSTCNQIAKLLIERIHTGSSVESTRGRFLGGCEGVWTALGSVMCLVLIQRTGKDCTLAPRLPPINLSDAVHYQFHHTYLDYPSKAPRGGVTYCTEKYSPRRPSQHLQSRWEGTWEGYKLNHGDGAGPEATVGLMIRSELITVCLLSWPLPPSSVHRIPQLHHTMAYIFSRWR